VSVPVTHSGKAGRGLIGSVAITLTEWSVREKGDELDATTAEDGGFEVIDTGVQGLTVTVKGYYFVGATKINPMAIGRGTNLNLYTYNLGSDVGPYWSIPNFAVTEFEHSSRVRDRIEFTATFRSRGSYTRPVDPP
jgi:hypothetical protein